MKNTTYTVAAESGSPVTGEAVQVNRQNNSHSLNLKEEMQMRTIKQSSGIKVLGVLGVLLVAISFISMAVLADNINGTNGKDTLVGTANDDTINGLGGKDLIKGLEGMDTLNGGPGNDTIFGGPDPDEIDGGAGNDTISGGDGNDDITGGPGNDTIRGGPGADTFNHDVNDGNDTYLIVAGDVPAGSNEDYVCGGGKDKIVLYDIPDENVQPNPNVPGQLKVTDPDTGGIYNILTTGPEACEKVVHKSLLFQGLSADALPTLPRAALASSESGDEMSEDESSAGANFSQNSATAQTSDGSAATEIAVFDLAGHQIAAQREVSGSAQSTAKSLLQGTSEHLANGVYMYVATKYVNGQPRRMIGKAVVLASRVQVFQPQESNASRESSLGNQVIPQNHNTCGVIAQVPGGEAGAEAMALAYVNSQLPMSFEGKVKVKIGPVKVKVKVKVTISNARDLDITCSTSKISFKFDIKVKVDKVGTFGGTGRIEGHYTVSTSPSLKICVSNLNLTNLNITNSPKVVDDFVRGQINQSGLFQGFCAP